jgi:hypothetical protein
MTKPQSIEPPKLESLEKLEVLLEILNEQSDKYVPYNEIEKEFMKRVNSKKKFNEVDLRNKLVNILNYAAGYLRDDVPLSNETGSGLSYVAYLADITQIRNAKLVIWWRCSKKGGKTRDQDCYMITLRGVEVLNHLRNSRHSKDLLISSKRLEILTIILIIFTAILIATRPLYVSLDVLATAIFIAILYFIFMKFYGMKKW